MSSHRHHVITLQYLNKSRNASGWPMYWRYLLPYLTVLNLNAYKIKALTVGAR